MGIVIGIDASRNRSGGAKAHILGILKDSDPRDHGIREVHIWSYQSLLDLLPDTPWLLKHNPPELERSLFYQLRWQYRSLPEEARNCGCNILLNTDAGTVCHFSPAVVMSRDMLSYEKGEMKRFGFSLARLRLILLKYVQAASMKRAEGVIFLTNYAAKVIQETTGQLQSIAIIPHGVGSNFKQSSSNGKWENSTERHIRCLYVSNASMYKHQWHVVRAIHLLRQRGHKLSLVLAGGGKGKAQQLLDEEIAHSDPNGEFVKQIDFVSHDTIPKLLAEADLFVFASSCENMPNTLVEAMASGLPIASSDRGPMPEVLKDGGLYFDPEDPVSISAALEKIINDEKLRITIAGRAKELSEQYSWARCAAETWEYLCTIGWKGKSLWTK